MECLSPILSDTTVHGRIWLPCSKCIACKQRAGREWFIRLKKHYEAQHLPSYFVTLTYAPEHLPFDELTGEATFNKSTIQNFIMSIRNCVKRGLPKELIIKNPVFYAIPERYKMSYFTIAERGDLQGRPHYHIMFFNVPFNKENFWQIIEYYWPFGRIDVGDVNDKSICYITDYMVTKDNENTEWRIMSKGISIEYVEKMKKYHRSKMDFKVPVHDKSFNMPRYMRKKIFTDAERKVIGKKITKEIQDKQGENYHEELNARISDLEAKIAFKKEKRRLQKFNKLFKRNQL